MRKVAAGAVVLCFAGLQSVPAQKTFINSQTYATDSDVVLESAVQAVKTAPKDTVDMVGDSGRFVADEIVRAARGVESAFKSDPVDSVRKDGLTEVGKAWSLDTDKIVLRSYQISESVGSDLAPGTQEGIADVSGSFCGIPFPKGTSAYYRPGVQRLIVKQTLENTILIEDVLADKHNTYRELTGHQIQIETKFVEVSQSTLNDLGFNWLFDSKSSGGTLDAKIFKELVLPANQELFSAGLRTAAGAFSGGSDPGTMLVQKSDGSLRWSMIISALEQADDSDVLSAPRLVTRHGKSALIQVGREQMMPKRFSARSPNASTYVEHSAWGKEIIGVHLEVTPELREGGFIDLNLKPRVFDHTGFDTYQVAPEGSLWPIQGRRFARAKAQGIYPVVTRGVDAVKGVYTNTIGKLYEAIGNTTSYLGGDSSYMHSDLPGAGDDPDLTPLNVNKPDVNDFTLHHTGSGTRGYHDRWRDWDPEELINVPEKQGHLPNYRIREMQTKVTVEDGSTVGMGGLIYDKLETYRDKVPVLGSIPLVGRLFRSEGERSTKRNLMIFVSAAQMDIHGRRAVDL